MVLRDKGCMNSMTAHKLLFTVKLDARGHPVFTPKIFYDEPYKLIVVDEISMLPKEMWDLIIMHKVPVIACGDPAQLPPIGEDNGVLANPHIFLDEIMRQAQDSEIIRLTMDIRAGKPLMPFHGTDVQVIRRSEAMSNMYLWADQVICAKNKTRHWINEQMRQMLYQTSDPLPLPGEKMICLRNYWQEINNYETPLINGMTCTMVEAHEEKIIGNYTMPKIIRGTVVPEGYDINDIKARFYNLNMDYKIFETGEPTINERTYQKIARGMHPKEFDFGYCITGWKAQGSEYNKVLAFEENFPSEDIMKRRFLYTVATRAKEKLILVMKE